MITIKQQYPRYITPLTVHKFLFQSYPIFSVAVYKTNKQTNKQRIVHRQGTPEKTDKKNKNIN